MNAPDFLEAHYDYTEFDGKPVEWWESYARKRKRIPVKIEDADKPALAAVLPEPSLQTHVARIATSQAEGRTTILTTSGVVIQFPPAQQAHTGPQVAGNAPRPHGAIFASRNVDAAGVAIVMAHYERKGFNFAPDQIPFGNSWPAQEQERIRKLWAEVQEQRQARPVPAELTPAARPRLAAPRQVVLA